MSEVNKKIKTHDFKEDAIASLITCKLCKQIFDEPVILPCGRNICSKHFISTSNNGFECNFCENYHNKSLSELPINEELEMVIRNRNKYVNIELIDFGLNNRLGRETCKALNELIKKEQSIITDPLNYIDDFFKKLKNRVDLTKEQYIQSIELNYHNVIEEISDLEKECISSMDQKSDTLSKLVAQAELKLNEWIKLLEMPCFSKDSEWKNVRFESQKEMNKIQSELEKLKDDLLLNRDYQFEPMPIIEQNNFAKFKCLKYESGVVSMEINNFSNLKVIDSKSSEYIKSNESCVIKNISWVINTRLEKINGIENLAIFVKPVCENSTLQENPILSKISLKIIQNEPKRVNFTSKRNFTYKFDKSNGYGFTNFISKQEIFNPLNGIYNQEKDSIQIEAVVKILA